MTKLRLGPLPRNETVRLTIALPAQVKADLDRYAELYRISYGEDVEVGALATQMIIAFMDRDRGFRRALHEAKPSADGSSPPSAITDATPSANDIPSDASSSR